ncbi:hypothetical protein N7447_009214 [Penicillium robsamsonii]|uniref:uncharacterized protein n=1 Tax=Penicillium robsamsonii TaxID=1792511 RepID=UPI0025495EB0|nr:uncharacterized protein N7447_009214 [Penicillium robsamsonii]KAJ5816981.1 hypothetical protein N7447_009214 [Penicillium robsamsonii]
MNTSARDWIKHPEKVSLIVELYRLFAQDFGDDLFEDLDTTTGAKSGFQGPPQALSLIQEYSFRSYSDLPLDFRFKRAMTLDTWWVHCVSPTTLQIAMGGDRIDPAAYLLKNDDGETLLCQIVRGMAVDFSAKRTDNLQQWRQLLSGAIAASADPCHLMFCYGRAFTPFVQFLVYFTKNWQELKRARYDFNPIVRLWASELKLAGVDLTHYGAKEKTLYTSGVVNLDLSIYVGLEKSGPAYDPNQGEYLDFHVLSLEYSSNPEDWKLWVNNPVDELVGEFWEMTEKREEIMPGTWID